MTEDLLEEHAKVLVQLGTDQEGAQLRARMQSTCLTSDMEAFKVCLSSRITGIAFLLFVETKLNVLQSHFRQQTRIQRSKIS